MAVVDISSKRLLSPIERISEILFGLVMTLSFTGTLSVVSGGREDVGIMLVAALGCNIAWGVIDGILYLLGTISERARGHTLLKTLLEAQDTVTARSLIAGTLPPVIASSLLPDDYEVIRRRLLEAKATSRPRMITAQDLGGVAGVFLLVVLSCVPVLLPFVIIHDPLPALRVSNGVAILMLFIGGYMLARYAGLPKIITGLTMILLGTAMVGLTIALGG